MARKEGRMEARDNSRSDERRNQEGFEMGRDAAYIKPKLIPDMELLPRDDSGGIDWDPYNMQFGDGGYVVGEKTHLSTKANKIEKDEAGEAGDEISQRQREEAGIKMTKGEKFRAPPAPAISKKRARE